VIGTIAVGFSFNHALTNVSRKPPNRNKFSKTNGLAAVAASQKDKE
jgi:hypothetical protein